MCRPYLFIYFSLIVQWFISSGTWLVRPQGFPTSLLLISLNHIGQNIFITAYAQDEFEAGGCFALPMRDGSPRIWGSTGVGRREGWDFQMRRTQWWTESGKWGARRQGWFPLTRSMGEVLTKMGSIKVQSEAGFVGVRDMQHNLEPDRYQVNVMHRTLNKTL